MAKKQKDKVETLTEQYKYTGEGQHMSDISASKPLVKKPTKPKKIEEKVVEKVEQVLEKQPSKKDMYISMIMENKPFTLKINGNMIFDSEQSNIMTLCFEDNYFRIGFEKYPYEGLNFKFKK